MAAITVEELKKIVRQIRDNSQITLNGPNSIESYRSHLMTVIAMCDAILQREDDEEESS